MDHNTSGTNWGNNASGTTFTSVTTPTNESLSGGSDGTAVTTGQLKTAYEKFQDAETVDVGLIIAGKGDATHIDNLITIAENRKDAIVFASPERSDVVNVTNSNTQTTNVINFFDSINSSSYVVFDSGYKYCYDRYNDVYRFVPLNGDIAGLAARTDLIADAWYSPAGFNRGIIRGAVKLAYNPTKAQRDQLYPKRVNPVSTFPGQGTVLFGDKTGLSSPSAFDRINVRRLFITLEKAISTASKFQLFEFNDEFTRANFRNIVEPFLREVQGRRGITDFLVVCDETNNTGEVIDRNEFVAEIFVKPARSINFITLQFVATRTGVAFEEVAG
jgi:phage tail sheath protein FI